MLKNQIIKNLPPQLNEAGKIKIGKKGEERTGKNGAPYRLPEKIDHFRLVTTEKDANGDYIRDTSLENIIKNSPDSALNANGDLVGLPIRLVSNEIGTMFPHQYVSYVSGKLSCRGDGEFSKKRLDNFETDHPCPCDRINFGYDGKDKCKPTGTLLCVMDSAELFGQAHTFRTTSVNTICGILGGVNLIKEATGGRVAWLPLMLTINEKNTVTPSGITTKIYVVSICFRGNVDQLRTKVLKQLATEKQYLIDTVAVSPVPGIGTEDEKSFVEEFFPSESNNAVKKPVYAEDGIVITSVEDTTENTMDLVATDTTDIRTAEAEKRFTGEPSGTYLEIYNRLRISKDFDSAMALARRLKLENIKYWLRTDYPSISFDEKIKKGELLQVAMQAVTIQCPPKKIDVSSPEFDAAVSWENVEEEIEDVGAKAAAEATTTEEKPVVLTWDESGPITREQKLELVKLKEALQTAGILEPQNWINNVKQFKDKEGRPMQTATKLTKVQGDTFIRVLKKYWKDSSQT